MYGLHAEVSLREAVMAAMVVVVPAGGAPDVGARLAPGAAALPPRRRGGGPDLRGHVAKKADGPRPGPPSPPPRGVADALGVLAVVQRLADAAASARASPLYKSASRSSTQLITPPYPQNIPRRHQSRRRIRRMFLKPTNHAA
eukprot:115644-Pyramimonas_sp.AAC.2